MTVTQLALLARLRTSKKGYLFISGPKLRTARALESMGKVRVGTRNPITEEPCPAFHGRWCWTVEEI